MQDLRVTLIQCELEWEGIDKNLSAFDTRIDTVNDDTDLIVLPEMFTTGFTMNAARVAQSMAGSAVTWLREKSISRNTDIAGSIVVEEDGGYYNRLVWAKPGGDLYTYDKKHLFRMLGEDKVYTAGDRLLTVGLNGWKIRPFICYDLRFPGWLRNLNNSYDAAIFIANWPEPRAYHWKLLLQARAVENLCYVIGVNRVGKDGNDQTYSGDSAVIDPFGSARFQQQYKSCIHTEHISCQVLEQARESFPVWKDADTDLFTLPD
jgi:predicted amidohydrolase